MRLYQKSVCKEYWTRLQSSATGFLIPDQRHFLSLYSYSFSDFSFKLSNLGLLKFSLVNALRLIYKFNKTSDEK